jgi:hypothetical protein
MFVQQYKLLGGMIETILKGRASKKHKMTTDAINQKAEEDEQMKWKRVGSDTER